MYLGPEGVIAKKEEYFVPCINHFYQKTFCFHLGQRARFVDQRLATKRCFV